MRQIYCDLCGKRLGTADASGRVSKKGILYGAFNNSLEIKSWKTIPQQSTQIECSYDLCDDCAKAIHRKLSHIVNNYTWRHGERKWD